MDLLLLFAGHLYPRTDSFPFRLRLHASVLSLLAEIVLCVFVKDQLFPLWDLFVCTFVKDQLLPFWGLAVCISQISTSSFLGVYPSVLRQISTPSFVGFARLYFAKYQLLFFWLRLHAAPLYLCVIITCSICHSLGLGCTRPRGAEIYPAITLIGPSVLCWRKDEKQVPQWLDHNECASYLGRSHPGYFCLIGPECTRPYTNNIYIYIYIYIHTHTLAAFQWLIDDRFCF